MATTIYVKNFPVLTGETCDTLAIQRAIKQCWDNNYDGDTILEFESGKEYLVNKELCVYGNYAARNKKFIIKGNNCVLRRTVKFTNASFGAVFSVYGLTKGLTYNPQYISGKTDLAFGGVQAPATNIDIYDLQIVFDEAVRKDGTLINGFGICNAKYVTLNDCMVDGAPQTNFALNSYQVGTDIRPIDTVLLNGCTGWNSNKHTFRFNAMESSLLFKAKMFNCQAYNTLSPDTSYSIPNKKVHLLCNVSTPATGNFSQVVENCYFDTTGGACITGYCKNVEFRYCKFDYPIPFYQLIGNAQPPVIIK